MSISNQYRRVVTMHDNEFYFMLVVISSFEPNTINAYRNHINATTIFYFSFAYCDPTADQTGMKVVFGKYFSSLS